MDIILMLKAHVLADNEETTKSTMNKSPAAHLQLPSGGPTSSAVMQTLTATRRVMSKSKSSQTCAAFFKVHS
jgi:uncharacterized protein YgiM (DUF1202 family)